MQTFNNKDQKDNISLSDIVDDLQTIIKYIEENIKEPNKKNDEIDLNEDECIPVKSKKKQLLRKKRNKTELSGVIENEDIKIEICVKKNKNGKLTGKNYKSFFREIIRRINNIIIKINNKKEMIFSS